MSIAEKLSNLGGKPTATLEDLQIKLQEEVIDLKVRRMTTLMKKIAQQRSTVTQQREIYREGDELLEMEEQKLKDLKEELEELKGVYQDNIETLKTVETILKIREEKRTAKANRIYGAIGCTAIAAGIGLAYGSDTWGTLINKHTMDAVKIAVSRFLPRLV